MVNMRRISLALAIVSVGVIGVLGCSKGDDTASKAPEGETKSITTPDNMTNSDKSPDKSAENPDVNTPKLTPKQEAAQSAAEKDFLAKKGEKKAADMTPSERAEYARRWSDQNAKSSQNIDLKIVGMPQYPGTPRVLSTMKRDTGRKIYYYNMISTDKTDKVLAWYKPYFKKLLPDAGIPFSIRGTSKSGMDTTVTARPWQDGSMTLVVITGVQPDK